MANQGKLLKEHNIPCIAFLGEFILANRNLWLKIIKISQLIFISKVWDKIVVWDEGLN
jgi:hypothetical protein